MHDATQCYALFASAKELSFLSCRVSVEDFTVSVEKFREWVEEIWPEIWAEDDPTKPKWAGVNAASRRLLKVKLSRAWNLDLPAWRDQGPNGQVAFILQAWLPEERYDSGITDDKAVKLGRE